MIKNSLGKGEVESSILSHSTIFQALSTKTPPSKHANLGVNDSRTVARNWQTPGLVRRVRGGAETWRVRVEGSPNQKITIPVGPEHPEFFEHYLAARAGKRLSGECSRDPEMDSRVRKLKAECRPDLLPIGDRPGYVYRYWSDRGTLLYIGVSVNAVARLGQHRKQAWFPRIARIAMYKSLKPMTKPSWLS